MAGYNELQVGRYSRFAGKFFSMKGPGILTSLVPELSLTMAMFYGAEGRYLEGWDRFAAFASQAAVAAQTSAIRMRNPGGSNVVAVFERVTVTNVAGATDFPTLNIGAIAADLATLVTLSSNNFDARGRPSPTLIQSRTTNAAALTSQVFEGATTVGTTFELVFTDIQEFPLLPGGAIQIQSGIVNQRLDVSFMWRERFLEESERA